MTLELYTTIFSEGIYWNINPAEGNSVWVKSLGEAVVQEEIHQVLFQLSNTLFAQRVAIVKRDNRTVGIKELVVLGQNLSGKHYFHF